MELIFNFKTMKKYIITILITISIAVTYIFQLQKETPNVMSDLLLENVDALARGEIDIPGVCAAISSEICILFDDGYFLTSVRVA